MSDTSSGVTFRHAKHGYDPDDVHARIDELTRQLSEARGLSDLERRRADECEGVVEGLRAEVSELERRGALPRYESVAQRVQAILEAADEAATELRVRAESEAAEHKRQAEDRAAQVLADARTEADALVGRGRRLADEAIAESERRVDGLSAEIVQLEQQRDGILNALGALRDGLSRAAHDLVTSANGAEPLWQDGNLVSIPPQEERQHPDQHPEDAHPSELSEPAAAEGR